MVSAFFRQAAILCIVGTALAAVAQDPVSVTHEPVWTGPPDQGIFPNPVRLRLESKSRQVTALVEVGNTTKVTIPVDLPPGSQKEVIAYLASDFFGQSHINVRAGRWQRQVEVQSFPPSFSGNKVPWAVGIVSDAAGELTFLSTKSAKPGPWDEFQFTPYSASAGRLPDRSTGFAGLQMLVLGEGAERMTDDEVRAAQAAMLGGMIVVVFGAEANPIFNDPRWAAYLPARPGETRSIRSSTFLANYAPVSAALPFTPPAEIYGSSVFRGPEGVIRVARAAGSGAMIYCSYDLLTGNARQWEGRKGVFANLAKSSRTDIYRGNSNHRIYASSTTNYYDDSMDPYGYGAGEAFDINLPSAGKVFLILLAYSIVVIPVNMLVLRALNKAQWIWLTAPLISLLFAGVFFQFASGLYNRGLTKLTNGQILTTVGSDLSVFLGDQYVLFPQPGNYDLGLRNVHHLSTDESNINFSPTGLTETTLPIVDVGELVAPSVSARSLQFSHYYIAQLMQGMPGIVVDATFDRATKTYTAVVTNNTEHAWKNVTVSFADENSSATDSIEPGKSATLRVKTTRADPVSGRLSFLTTEFTPGVQLGEEISPDGGTSVLASFEVKQ